MSIPLFKVAMDSTATQKVGETLNSGFITQGPKVDEFETRLKEYFGTHRLLTLNSATSGLTLAIKMMNLPPESEILICPLTCFATTSTILANGHVPKWIDVDPKTSNMDLEDLENKITEKTRAICFVHWGGNPLDMDKLEKIRLDAEYKYGNNIQILEDCAHAFGAEWDGKKLGTFGGTWAVYSFQAIKHLTTGDGGMLIVPNDVEYERAKKLRWFGIDRENRKDSRIEEDICEPGYKYHMNDINATIGLANLDLAIQNVEKHIENAKHYAPMLGNINCIDVIKPLEKAKCSYWIYTMRVNCRDEFIEFMKQRNVSVSPVHRRNDTHSCVKMFTKNLPKLDIFETEMICIPVGWWLTKRQLNQITKSVYEFYKQCKTQLNNYEHCCAVDAPRNKKVVIGGWGNTGTRLVMLMLHYKGFELPNFRNNMYDYLGEDFPKIMKRCWESGNYKELYEYTDKDLNIDENCAIKHGHFILHSKGLINRYENCKIIACIRDPYDMIMNKYGQADPNYGKFGYGNGLLDRVKTLKMWYDKAKEVGEGNYMIVRLEDLLYDKINTMKKIYDFVGVDNKITAQIEDIVGAPSKFVGTGRAWIEAQSNYNEEVEIEIQKLRSEFGYFKEE